MPTLGQMLGSGFLDRYRAREAQIQQEPVRELQQAGAALKLQEALQGQQERQTLASILASGQDPRAAIPALVRAGPAGVKMAGSLAEILKLTEPKPAEPFTLSPGAVRYDAKGNPIASVPHAPQRPLADNRPEILRLQEMISRLPPEVGENHPIRKQLNDRIGMLTTRAPSGQPSQLGRLMAERDALPPNDPRRRDYDRAITDVGRPPQGPQPQAPVAVIGPDGQPVLVPPGQSYGQRPALKPDERRAQREEESAVRRAEGAVSRADMVIGKIDEALNKTGFFGTGLTGAVLGAVPGTGAYDLRRVVDTIKANIGFQELQAMREASPTGGALGQVAVKELDMLQAVLASLDANQSEAQLRSNLGQAKKHFQNWRDLMRQQAGTNRIVVDY